MYTREGSMSGPILFADDNVNTLSLPSSEDIRPLLHLYQEYQEVSGLNLNIRKTQALCINTRLTVIDRLRGLEIDTPEYIKHLSPYLGQDIESTVTETMNFFII